MALCQIIIEICVLVILYINFKTACFLVKKCKLETLTHINTFEVKNNSAESHNNLKISQIYNIFWYVRDTLQSIHPTRLRKSYGHQFIFHCKSSCLQK
jgi:hypothetical protein